MSLGGKYVFATVMCLVLPMCILTSCSSVLMVFGMFVNVMSLLMSVMSPLIVCVPCQCVWWCMRYFLCFILICEF